MSISNGNDINALIGKFMDLLEQWEDKPQTFNWNELRVLAKSGAQAYNEGGGPSFHALALDGVPHSEFHERFLEYSLESSFDPFKIVKAGSGNTLVPVISHSSLADASRVNPSSARMRAALMEIARGRFDVADENTDRSNEPNWFRIVEAAAESIPSELLARIAPTLVKT